MYVYFKGLGGILFELIYYLRLYFIIQIIMVLYLTPIFKSYMSFYDHNKHKTLFIV